ncbi:DNA-binding response regulator, AraC family, partial [hydrothermal vent metagenome]
MRKENYNIIILVLLLSYSLSAQNSSYKFNHLTVENGLSNNVVNAVIQDSTGFIWFGTEDGLNRYDGYKFRIFRYDSEDSNSISDNKILALTEDREGNIWAGTKDGVLNRFDPITEKFTHWELRWDVNEKNSIKTIYIDSRGNIWIGKYNRGGLYKLNPTNNTIDHWAAIPGDPKSLSNSYVLSIIEDEHGKILIGTYNGLNVFDPDLPQNGFKRIYHDPAKPNGLSNNIIWALSKSKVDPNIIWVGTSNNLTKYNSTTNKFETIEITNPDNLQYGTSSGNVVDEIIDGKNILWVDSYAGLFRIDLTSAESSRFINDENNSKSIVNNQINKMIKDRSGVIWLVTQNGVSYITPKSTLFNSFNFDYNTTSILKKKNITALAKFSDDKIWIGTSDELYLLSDINDNPTLRKISRFDGYYIWSSVAASENEVWIGTYGRGLKQFNFLNNKIKKWDINRDQIKTQSLYYNKTLLEDSKKNIWVGYWGVGVARIDPQSGIYKMWLNDPNDPNSLSNNDVWTIAEDQFGRIWIGTQGGGLNVFIDKKEGTFYRWLQKGGDKNSISSNSIYSIIAARKLQNSDNSETVLWIGTSNGLNRFEIKNNNNNDVYDIDVKIESYTVKDGLPDNTVNSIVEDEKGNLWLGTNSGISLFDVNKRFFINFSKEDGLNGTIMNPEAALKLDNGLMLFGSTAGLNVFDPGNIKRSSYVPPIVITDFQIFNKTVQIGENSPLQESIQSTDEIVLSNDQNIFSIEFASLDYNSNKLIQYKYKMEGFDENWINSGSRRFVTYTNLNAGEYRLKVKSTNADGVWNDREASLRIIVTPPWWKSLWAYVSYFILIILGLITIRRFEINRTKLRSELKIHEFEIKKKSELEGMKSRFFANLSHEFRTPLMLIKGPLEQLKKGKNNGDHHESIELIERNSDRLRELIEQLLELSQLEAAAIPLKAKQVNLITILKGLVSSFELIAKQKSILLKFTGDLGSELIWIDRDKFEKIIINLLSNAVKFTPDGGSISVKASELIRDDKQYAEIEIMDSGISIPKEKLEKIFDRFYQVEDSNHRSYKGSGIGLALVKEFVDLHKWEISVESEMGEGTVFNLLIPMWDDYLNEDEKVAADSSNNIESNDIIKKDDEELIKQEVNIIEEFDHNKMEKKYSILIVDDSEDIRKYLSGLLKSEYTIYTASNGEEGIKAAIELLPDLILSDVMMPLMDGIEFCTKIKTDWQTSEIPVILLTAKASFENKLEGLETGADAYLTKPCDTRELSIRIRNLIEQRERLRNKFSKDLDLLNDNNKLTTADDDFIKKALEIIEGNLDKTNFSTERMAKELFVSRTQLHRKILSITGQTPGVFIRTIKLKRAAKLLLEKRLSVTQIAYEI